MCGRYGLYDISESEILKENIGYAFTPNYNAAPTQLMPVITEKNGKQTAQVMRWGIERTIGKDMEKDVFNTRAENALGRFWGRTVREHRCLVPANGFYEWQKTSEGKIPYWIFKPKSKLMYLAGIYSTNAAGDLEYSIMTTSPNHEMASIHDRMPVILPQDAQEVWLTTTEDSSELLKELLRPLPDDSLDMFEVSTAVNVVRNNSGDLIVPINSK